MPSRSGTRPSSPTRSPVAPGNTCPSATSTFQAWSRVSVSAQDFAWRSSRIPGRPTWPSSSAGNSPKRDIVTTSPHGRGGPAHRFPPRCALFFVGNCRPERYNPRPGDCRLGRCQPNTAQIRQDGTRAGFAATVVGRVGGLEMNQFAPESFARSGTRVRSPISKRRSRRLMRFAAISLLATIVGLGLLAVGIGAL